MRDVEAMIKILVGDDHEVVRRGLIGILEEEYDMSVVSEAANAPEVIENADSKELDIVVLDISMPGGGGLEALKELKLRHPGLPVLILSVHPEEQYAVRVMKAGAAGYLTKDTAPSELVTAIRRVVSGRKYVSATLAEKLVEALEGGDSGSPHEKLSDREYQLMVHIARGKTVSEIAEELSLSVKTVSTYRARLLQKMNLRNNAEVMRYALERHLVD